EVGAVEQVREEAHEALALRDRQLLPVGAHRALRHLGEVEDLVGDLADARPALLDLGRPFGRRVAQSLNGLVDAALELLDGGVGRYGGGSSDQEQKGCERMMRHALATLQSASR